MARTPIAQGPDPPFRQRFQVAFVGSVDLFGPLVWLVGGLAKARQRLSQRLLKLAASSERFERLLRKRAPGQRQRSGWPQADTTSILGRIIGISEDSMTQPTAPALSAEEQAKVDASGAVATALDTARSKLKAAGDELGKKVKDLNVATAKTRLTEATAELKTAREKIGGALESDRTGLTSQIEVIELAIAQQQTIVEGIEERAKDKEKDEAKEDDDY